VSDDDQEALEREALERLRGFALPQEWPPGALRPGVRVRVIQDPTWGGPWLRVFSAKISALGAPEPARSRLAEPGELEYWVEFDEPELDRDADGPYDKAQIWDRYLETLD
jgi:hypothetical protein